MKTWRVSGLSRRHIKAEIQAGSEHPTLFDHLSLVPTFISKRPFWSLCVPMFPCVAKYSSKAEYHVSRA